MSSSKPSYLLDTSALFVLLLNDAGADRVEHILTRETALILSVSLLELYYATLRERGRQEADLRYALVRKTSATIVWEIDEPTLLNAAALKVSHNIPMADAVIAGAAIAHNAVLVHRDPELEALAPKVTLEALPYRRSLRKR